MVVDQRPIGECYEEGYTRGAKHIKGLEIYDFKPFLIPHTIPHIHINKKPQPKPGLNYSFECDEDEPKEIKLKYTGIDFFLSEGANSFYCWNDVAKTFKGAQISDSLNWLRSHQTLCRKNEWAWCRSSSSGGFLASVPKMTSVRCS